MYYPTRIKQTTEFIGKYLFIILVTDSLIQKDKLVSWQTGWQKIIKVMTEIDNIISDPTDFILYARIYYLNHFHWLINHSSKV